MTHARRRPLRIALLDHAYAPSQAGADGAYVQRLARAMLDAGHRVTVLSAHRHRGTQTVEDGIPVVRVRCQSEALLRRRGFSGPLTHVPLGIGVLVAGRFDAAHAFSTPDALMARVWRRLVRRSVTFTCLDAVGRECLADRRLRLSLLERAVSDSDAVIAATEAVRDSLMRWLAVDVPVLDAHDVEGHERLYGVRHPLPSGPRPA